MNLPTEAQRLAQRQEPDGSPVMKQTWSGLSFSHWEIDPELIQERLPEGLFVDLFEGKAWIGVVPFFMEKVRPVYLPPVPGLSWFHELNVRTYVHDSAGNPGVWFFSLDCNQPLAVEIAKALFNLPYEHAKMSSERGEDFISYHCTRKSEPSRPYNLKYSVVKNPQPAIFGTLEWFLVKRYSLFAAKKNGKIFSGRVHHQPYLIEAAPLSTPSIEPLHWNKFSSGLGQPSSNLIAAPVDVTIYPLKAL